MCVSNQNKICSLNVRIDGGNVGRGNVIPPIRPARVSSYGAARSSRWRRPIDSRQIGIDQNHRDSIGDFPASSSQVFENDLIALFWAALFLSRENSEHSYCKYTAHEPRSHHWSAPPCRTCRGVYLRRAPGESSHIWSCWSP